MDVCMFSKNNINKNPRIMRNINSSHYPVKSYKQQKRNNITHIKDINSEIIKILKSDSSLEEKDKDLSSLIIEYSKFSNLSDVFDRDINKCPKIIYFSILYNMINEYNVEDYYCYIMTNDISFLYPNFIEIIFSGKQINKIKYIKYFSHFCDCESSFLTYVRNIPTLYPDYDNNSIQKIEIFNILNMYKENLTDEILYYILYNKKNYYSTDEIMQLFNSEIFEKKINMLNIYMKLKDSKSINTIINSNYLFINQLSIEYFYKYVLYNMRIQLDTKKEIFNLIKDYKNDSHFSYLSLPDNIDFFKYDENINFIINIISYLYDRRYNDFNLNYLEELFSYNLSIYKNNLSRGFVKISNNINRFVLFLLSLFGNNYLTSTLLEKICLIGQFLTDVRIFKLFKYKFSNKAFENMIYNMKLYNSEILLEFVENLPFFNIFCIDINKVNLYNFVDKIDIIEFIYNADIMQCNNISSSFLDRLVICQKRNDAIYAIRTLYSLILKQISPLNIIEYYTIYSRNAYDNKIIKTIIEVSEALENL